MYETEKNGILVFDKPSDISSARSLDWLKKKLGVKKAGHTGTLDPFATGVLVCCFDRATRLARFLLHGKKKYNAELTLGVETDTQDLTGKPTAFGETKNVQKTDIIKTISGFLGPQKQIPPAFSALKHQGTPLYRLARGGKRIHKPPREIEIFDIRVIEIRMPKVMLEVTCSSGTYIRSLCHDIGNQLGCHGHLSALRRLEKSGFYLKEAITQERVLELVESGKWQQHLIPMAEALRDMPKAEAENGLIEKIRHGRPVKVEDMSTNFPEGDTFVKVVDKNNALMAVLHRDENTDGFRYSCNFSVPARK